MHVGNKLKLGMALLLSMSLLSPGMALAQAPHKGGSLNLVKAAYLTVGSDTTYPPMESSDLKHPGTYVGADIDIAKALARAMGLKGAKIVSTSFATIIPSLQRRSFDVILSSMNDNPLRRKQIAFVDYMKLTAAEGILVNKSSSLHGVGYKILCGHSVAVETATTELADLQAATKKCKSSKINIKAYAKDTDAFGALRAGHADAYTGDDPVVLYYAHTYKGTLRLAGKAFGSGGYYGIGLLKSNAALKAALQNALTTIHHNGTYAKILNKWGLGKTAI